MTIPSTMLAVVTTGNGGLDKLQLQTVPTPRPAPGEVLVQVLAAGVNNTEINTRLGWYSKTVDADTDGLAAEQQAEATHKADGGWSEPTPFPLIQGTDVCGRVVAAGEGVTRPLGERVLLRPCMRGDDGFGSMETRWMGTDFAGGFAQFVAVPAGEAFAVDCDWTDVQLASIPCAYGTAENMVGRANVGPGDHVLVPGASGGVGSAVVQLCKRRGATVTALCGPAKADRVAALGADRVLGTRFGAPGWAEAVAELTHTVDVVVDNVGGDAFPDLINTLERGGRYVTSGAIAGPIVALDLRTLYLRDLTLIGSTAWDERVLPDLVGYIERGELRPVIAGTFPLERIGEAQTEFLTKQHVGKFVLTVPIP